MYPRKSIVHFSALRLFLLLSLSLLHSCGRHVKPGPSGFADESFADKLSESLTTIDTTGQSGKIRSVSEELRLVYQADEYQPIWVKENYSSTVAAAQLLTDLEEMQWDGVDPEVYNINDLRNLKTKLDTTKHNAVADAIRFDTTLTHSYLAASRFLLLGSIKPRKADSLWHHVNDTVWNAAELLLTSGGAYPALDSFRSELPTYQALRKEYRMYRNLLADSSYLNAKFNMAQCWQNDSVIKVSADYIIRAEMPWVEVVPNDSISDRKQLIMAYQRAHSLRVTRKLDSTTVATLAVSPEDYLKKLCANMERIRWMKRKTGSLYIVVNVPLMELFFRKDGVDVMHKEVVVGKRARQTPSLFANMTNIVINPPWGVPPTILKNDVLPGIQKSGRQYLAKKGLKVYTHEGKAVNVSTINAKNYKRYTYKQAPGSDNSLGYVKFNMPNKWDIYLHDTPHREDFGKHDRALSSGCVRVHEPQEMALYILAGLEQRTSYTQGKLDTMISTHKTRWELLKTKIPVFITYLTAFEDSTGAHIRFARDIYQRDEKLMALMN
jgi:murein L,D-transpeptidase YcbB/YkuD